MARLTTDVPGVTRSGERIRPRPPLDCSLVSTAAVQRALDPRRPEETQYRAWSPPYSSITIEYSQELLREVRLTSLLGDASGVLYGTRNGHWIRVVAAQRALNQGGFEGDPRLAGLEPIGVFFARARGKIFLTESDLEQFALSDRPVALVVAGTKAGFFLFEADGSIETIKSHEEFGVLGVGPLAGPLERRRPERRGLGRPGLKRTGPVEPRVPLVAPPKFMIETLRVGAWVWMMPAAILAIALLFMTRSYWLPRPAIALAAHDQFGQLRIRWNPAAAAATPLGVTLEIADGNAHISMPLSPEFASATYVRRTSDVQIHLTAAGHTESVRFFGADLPVTPLGVTREQVDALEAEAQTLDSTLERGTRQIARLQTAITDLLHFSR